MVTRVGSHLKNEVHCTCKWSGNSIYFFISVTSLLYLHLFISWWYHKHESECHDVNFGSKYKIYSHVVNFAYTATGKFNNYNLIWGQQKKNKNVRNNNTWVRFQQLYCLQPWSTWKSLQYTIYLNTVNYTALEVRLFWTHQWVMHKLSRRKQTGPLL